MFTVARISREWNNLIRLSEFIKFILETIIFCFERSKFKVRKIMILNLRDD